MKRFLLIGCFLFAAAVGGVAWWYLFAPGSVPDGQPPLGGEAVFRQAFQAGVGRSRIVAVFSPTTPADLVTAQYLQGLLMEYENNKDLDGHIVWQQVLQTDWAPTTDGMARVWDVRVRQYWVRGGFNRDGLDHGTIYFYSRGAGLDSPALRVKDLKAALPEIRRLLGPPAATPGR